MSSRLRDAIEAVRSVSLAGLSDDDADGLVAELAELRCAVDALWLHVVADAEARGLHRRHHARDLGTWLAGLTGDRVGAVRRDVELAGVLATAPIVGDAAIERGLSKPKTAELARAADLPCDLIQALAEAATTQSVEQVAGAVRRARLDHHLPEPEVVASCAVLRHHDRVRVDATLDLVDGEVLEVALDAYASSAHLSTELPYARRRAAALVGLARHYLDHAPDLATTRMGRPHVLVLVDLAVLEARGGGSATLASGAVISGDAARGLAADACITRVVTSGASQVLDVGRTTRTVPTPIAKAVIARDRHCRYVGCTSPSWACEIHHWRPWASGGTTALENLGLLCWHHHQHVVHRGDPARLRDDGRGRWTTEPLPAREVAA